MKKLDKNDIIRFALFIGDSQSKTFKSTLLKMIELILFDKYGTYISQYEIVSDIQNRFEMDFASGEVSEVLERNKNNTIIKENNRYTLSPERHQLLKSKENINSIEHIVHVFIEENDLNYDESEVCDLVQRYIYYKFNSDITTMEGLISPGKIQLDFMTENFTNKEKDILNQIFNWENEEKNHWLFEVVSSCLQYCMMSLKRDKFISELLFNGKEFFLDSNIIFRLAGLNKEERKNSIEAFINRCKSCGIKIKYTNFTRKEVFDTIKYMVNAIKQDLNGSEPLDPSIIRKIYGGKIDDLYHIYFEWTKEKENRYDDYKAFETYLNKKLFSLLNEFQLVTHDTFNGLNNNNYDFYLNELNTYERSRGRTKGRLALQTDIENYFFIKEKSLRESANSFIEKKTFFISADHVFIDWTISKAQGAIPLFVLPSVWYSIILSYSGRATKDDFRTFCQFLKLRQSNEKVKYEEEMKKAGDLILKLKEPAKIKEEVIFDVEQKIIEANADTLTDDEINTIVQESYSYVTDKMIDKTKEEYNQIISQKEEQAEKKYNNGYNDGQVNTLNKIAEENVSRNKKILCIVRVVMIAAIILILYLIYNKKIELEILNNNLVVLLITPLSALVLSFIKPLARKVLNTDTEYEIKKLKVKFSKEDTQ